MFDWLFGSSSSDSPCSSNPQSMHYKSVPLEDRLSMSPVYFTVGKHAPTKMWSCPSCSSEHEILAQIITTDWVECENCIPKPHYKWSWKLNKAVRL